MASPTFIPEESKFAYLIPQDEVIAEGSTPDFTEKTIVKMTATETYSKTESAVVSNFPVSENQNQGDHYRDRGAVINLSGIIAEEFLSIFNAFSDAVTIESYIATVKSLIKMQKADGSTFQNPLVTVYLPDGNYETNCVITSFKIDRNASISNGYRVSIALQKLLVARQSEVGVVSEDTFESTTTSSDASGKEVKPVKAPLAKNQGLG